MINIFEINDLKNIIFSYLRKKPKLECCTCKKVLIWDKVVNKFFEIPTNDYKKIYYQCTNCYYLASTRDFF